MNIAVVGTGYVGLVVGTCLAEVGNDVVCADIVEEKIARLNAGDPEALSEAKRRFGDRIELTEDAYAALDGAAALVIHTDVRGDLARRAGSDEVPHLRRGLWSRATPGFWKASPFESPSVGGH